MSLDAVDSYPQKLINLQRNDYSYCAIISTFAAYDDVKMREIALRDKYMKNYSYPDSISPFIEPTPLTNCDIPRIRNIADSILNYGDSLSIRVISRFLRYTSKSIKYDNKLAQEIGQGRCTTLDVETISDRRKGTCREYTNLFISLMRAAKIPCRMVVGYNICPKNKLKELMRGQSVISEITVGWPLIHKMDSVGIRVLP